MNAELAQLINSRPGSSYAEVRAFYGSFDFSNARSPRGAIIMDQRWVNENFVTLGEADLPGFPFKKPYNRNGMPCHKKIARALVLTWTELVRRGLDKYMVTWDGTWTARHILWNPVNELSLHSWGIALDSNVYRLPYGTPLKSLPRELLEFYQCWEECGWTWGGRWSPADCMHTQWTDPLPGTPRGMTPLKSSLILPKPPVADKDGLEGKKLIVNGDYLGAIAKGTKVDDKVYITTRDD